MIRFQKNHKSLTFILMDAYLPWILLLTYSNVTVPYGIIRSKFKIANQNVY